MSTNVIKMIIQLRRDTYENWELNKDIIPAAGEPCFVLDKNILKIGDGITTFENLKPVGGIRLDCLSITQEQLDEGSGSVYVDYFGFFKTVEDAQNWNPAHVTNAQ